MNYYAENPKITLRVSIGDAMFTIYGTISTLKTSSIGISLQSTI